MRVLIIVEDLAPGGATLVLQRIIAFHRAQGAEVICVCGDAGAGSADAYSIRFDVNARKGGLGLKGRLSEFPAMRRLLAAYHPDLVVINATSPGFMYAFMYQSRPVLYHLHTDISSAAGFPRKLVYPNLRGRNKRVVVVSERQRDNVEERWGLRAEHIVVLPNYPDREVALHSDRNNILTAGRFHWSKNPSLWKRVGIAMNEVLERQGAYMIWCAPSLGEDALAFEKDLPSRLRLVQIREQDELNEYFAQCAIYYQPSTVEPQGIAVLEAMQNGIPCIVTEGTGMSDAVHHGINGIIAAQDDVDAHGEALRCLLEDRALAAAYGEEGKTLVQQQYLPEYWERAYRDHTSRFE